MFCPPTAIRSSSIVAAYTAPLSGGSLLLMILVDRFHREAEGPPPHTNQSPAVLTVEINLAEPGEDNSASLYG